MPRQGASSWVSRSGWGSSGTPTSFTPFSRSTWTPRVNCRRGQGFGTDWSQPVTVKAKPGYAVGAITGRVGGLINGFSVTFAKIARNGPDPRNFYESDWIGDRTGGSMEPTLSGGGQGVVGIMCRPDGGGNVSGLGLIFAPAGGPARTHATKRLPVVGAAAAAAGPAAVEASPGPANAPAGGPPAIILGGAEGKCEIAEDRAPPGGMLIGLEVGRGGVSANGVVPIEAVSSVRPIYLDARGKQVVGSRHGVPGPTAITKAKPGYAIGRN